MVDTGQLRRFGVFTLDSRSRELLKDGARLKLQEQPFQILCALVDRAGEVVSRDDLRRRVWPGNTFVDFDSGLNVAIAKLRQALDDNADHPTYIETLPRLGYRFIAPVEILSAEPADDRSPLSSAKRMRSRWFWLAGSTVLLLAVAIWIPFSKRTIASVTPRPSVAIMGFRNLTARTDYAWLSTALSEMLATELAAGDKVRTIPGESATRAKLEMQLPDAESYSAPTLTKIRKRLGADYILVGSYLDSGADSHRVRLDLRLQDAQTGETIAALPFNGGEDDLSGLVARAGSAIRQKLVTGFVSQADSTGARAALPPTTDTARLYAEGLDRLRHFDARGARDLLEQAVAVDPNYALAHSALSDAWSSLGYQEVAREEARKAWGLSNNLPRTDRFTIEARFRESNSEWDQAIRIYQGLAQQFADNAEFGLRLAGAQINAGKANEAMATLIRLGALPPPLADEASIKLVQAQAAEKLGDFERAQAAASEAATVARNRGAQILEADARALVCRQLVQLSRLEQAVVACEASREIYDRAGDRLGLAASMAYLAAAYYNQGNSDEARKLYTQAVQINREIGNARGDAQWALNGLAVLLSDHGDLSGARNLFEESLAMARLTGSRPDEASALGNIGTTFLNEGNLKQARDLFSQALKRARTIGAKSIVASVQNNLGQTLYLLGLLPESEKMLVQAEQSDRETGSKLESADALCWLGHVRMAQANWEEARHFFDASVQAAGEISGQVFAAQYRLGRAELALEMGRPSDAEGPIRQALEVFRLSRVHDRELEAHALLARALLDQGKAAEARQIIGQAAGLAGASQQRTTRLLFAIASANVQAASGKAADLAAATRQLQTTAAEAGRQGFLGYQLQARLVLAQIQKGPAARVELEKLEKDARAAGFEAIARQAARNLTKS